MIERNKVREIFLPNIKAYYVISNQDTVVLTEEQNKEPRGRAT